MLAVYPFLSMRVTARSQTKYTYRVNLTVHNLTVHQNVFEALLFTVAGAPGPFLISRYVIPVFPDPLRSMIGFPE